MGKNPKNEPFMTIVFFSKYNITRRKSGYDGDEGRGGCQSRRVQIYGQDCPVVNQDQNKIDDSWLPILGKCLVVGRHQHFYVDSSSHFRHKEKYFLPFLSD